MGSKPRFGIPFVQFEPTKVISLHRKGLSDEEMAKELSVCEATVKKWRKALSLKANRPLPKEGVSQLSLDAREARRNDMNYGMWKAMQYEKAGRPAATRRRRLT